MKKTIANPETGEWAEHDVAYSDAVIVEHPTHKRAYITGMISDAPDIEQQTREVLTSIESILEDHGGDMRDVVRVRVYINNPHMTEESLETVHGVRLEFFDEEHLPSSTLVEVEDLVDEASYIEIDADAVIPDDGWDVDSR